MYRLCWTPVSNYLGYLVPKGGIAGSSDHSIFNLLRNHQTVILGSWAILLPDQQGVRLPMSPHPCPLFLFSGFLLFIAIHSWNLIHCRWECKMVLPFWKTVDQFLLKYLLTQDSRIPLLGIYLREEKGLKRSFIHITKSQIQPPHPPADRWMNRLQCPPATEYSARTHSVGGSERQCSKRE